mgnify:CR=1 FL=1
MKHQDIRDKIHLTYLSLVTSQDASTINVRKLAEAAGIARSTFYIYFDNIEILGQKCNSVLDMHMVVELAHKIYVNGSMEYPRNCF